MFYFNEEISTREFSWKKIHKNLPSIHKIMMLALLGPEHVRVESSRCCFARELVSCVRPR